MINRKSPAAIAAEVHQTNRHRVVEVELRKLRAQRTEIDERMRALIAGRPLTDEDQSAFAMLRPGAAPDRQITKLAVERSKLNERINGLLAQLQPLRQADGQAVTDALGPIIAGAARDALYALSQFHAAMSMIAQCHDAASRRRAEVDRQFVPDLGSLEGWLRRRAGSLHNQAQAAE